jgi:hypothetical protein
MYEGELNAHENSVKSWKLIGKNIGKILEKYGKISKVETKAINQSGVSWKNWWKSWNLELFELFLRSSSDGEEGRDEWLRGKCSNTHGQFGHSGILKGHSHEKDVGIITLNKLRYANTIFKIPLCIATIF